MRKALPSRSRRILAAQPGAGFGDHSVFLSPALVAKTDPNSSR